MLFRLKKCQKGHDLAQESREMYTQRRKHGQQKLTPIMFAARAVKQWLQTTGNARDLEGYRMCTYTYTSPTAMVLISVGYATRLRNHRSSPNLDIRKLPRCWVRQSPTEAFFLILVPSMGILPKTILKSLGDLLPLKFGQRTNLLASLTHWLGVTITAQHSTTACNPSNQKLI